MKLSQFFLSTIGKKFLVAITGLFMVLFLIVHLLGNLEIFSGPNAINQYSAFLHSIPKSLWGFRILLIFAVVIHVWLTISLTSQNRSARKDPYLLKKSRKASFTSRYMMITGITIIVFVCYHLAHFTLGITNPEYVKLTDELGRHHVYNMMVMGFSNPWVSGFYVLAQILIAFHLSHGVSSTARTLGVASSALYEKIQKAGILFAVIIAVLYISIPFSVMTGILRLDY